MTDNQDFQVVVGGLISSASSDNEGQDVLGRGTYGEVTLCRKVAISETVALKIFKKQGMHLGGKGTGATQMMLINYFLL